jgi:hypothetical protein
MTMPVVDRFEYPEDQQLQGEVLDVGVTFVATKLVQEIDHYLTQEAQTPTCPSCGAQKVYVPPGVSKRTGQAYPGFWSCRACWLAGKAKPGCRRP